MRISGNYEGLGSGGLAGMGQADDSYSKSIRSQIRQAQKQLQELGANENMGLEEKMKKRQELQKQITELNSQLRQHQMQQKRERQAEGATMEDMLGTGASSGAARTGSHKAGLSRAHMKAMTSADMAMEQARVQGCVATRMEGRAGVLEIEIALDSGRGGSVEAKKEELADVEATARNATSAQMDTLSEANRTLEEAAREEREERKAENPTDKRTEGETETETEKETEKKAPGTSASDAGVTPVSGEPAEGVIPAGYRPVDVRL